MIDSTSNIVLQLIRKAINPFRIIELPDGINWDRILGIASNQGVLGICMEAIEHLPYTCIPRMDKLQWFGQSELQRGKYQLGWDVACKLDELWSAEGIHAILLKGRSIAKYYAFPYHRYSCDLDVFIAQDWERACDILEGQGIKLGHEVYKEVEFKLDDVYVECHRFITPLRGNKKLQEFELYLRSLLDYEQPFFFEGTTLVCPPLMFTVMLYVEHALGDFLHGHLSLKQIVDWVVMRRQEFDREVIEARCEEFGFDRFLKLVDALADVVEGAIEYEDLSTEYKKAFDEVFKITVSKRSKTWFQRRVALFFNIVKNGEKYRKYGYMSMPSFLWNSVWTHFFDKDVRTLS